MYRCICIDNMHKYCVPITHIMGTLTQYIKCTYSLLQQPFITYDVMTIGGAA